MWQCVLFAETDAVSKDGFAWVYLHSNALVTTSRSLLVTSFRV